MPSQSRSARQLPRTRGSQNVTSRPGLPRLRGRWPAGPERATTNNAGASLYSRPPQRDPIFRDAKFFCFGAINNRRNYWLGISFLLSHRMGVYPNPQTVSSHLQAPYIKHSMVLCICYK